MIWNTCFDPAALEYDAEYENSLAFSGAFQRYTDELITRLISSYDLSGGVVAEIGSGKGEFLAELCERANCSGIGWDPSYTGEMDGRAPGRLTFVRELFGPDADLSDARLVVSRHVVEHLEDPVGVLAMVRRALGPRAAALYVEVPAAELMLAEDTIWDIIYPHVTVMSATGLREVLTRAGFHPNGHGYSFGDQYLWVEASTEPVRTGIPAVAPARLGDGDGFAARLADKRASWAERLPRLVAEGPVALWGAGAKGTTFLNVVEGGESIEWVVDVNPRKQGTYVPGTGHRIVGPDALEQQAVRAIVVMNPIYSGEIARALEQLGVEAELLVA